MTDVIPNGSSTDSTGVATVISERSDMVVLQLSSANSTIDGRTSVGALFIIDSMLGVWEASPLSDSGLKSQDGVDGGGDVESEETGSIPGLSMFPTTSTISMVSSESLPIVAVGLINSTGVEGRIVASDVTSVGFNTNVCPSLTMFVRTILFSPSTEAIVCIAGCENIKNKCKKIESLKNNLELTWKGGCLGGRFG